VALNRISCPECGAAVKSAAGFVPGDTVACTKCETEFTVPDQTDDDLSTSKESGEPAWSYKNSWLRYAVLGVLLVVLCVLGFLLYDKRMKDNKDSSSGGGSSDDIVKVVNPTSVGPYRT
jgi:hypothetical protein